MSSAPLLRLDDLHYTYPGTAQPALSGASLEIWPGQRIALIGRNGSGKSTLFLHCNGILQPERGALYLHGERIRYSPAALIRLRGAVGLVLQNPDDQLFSASVMQDISFGPLNQGLTEAEARQRVEEAARACDVLHLLSRPTHALSGGEKMRAALAGVLAMNPALILADEVLAMLDPWMRRQALALFDALAGDQGRAVLLATHDLGLAFTWPDVLVIMHQGRVAAAAPPSVLRADAALLAATGLDQVL